MRTKRNTKMHDHFQWQRSMTLLCLFTTSAKSPCLLEFFLDHCILRIHSYSFWIYQDEPLFLIESNSIRGLNSTLPFPNCYYQSCDIFSPVFIFNNACKVHEVSGCPHSPTLRQFVGQFIVGKKHGWKMSLTQLCRRFTNRLMSLG